MIHDGVFHHDTAVCPYCVAERKVCEAADKWQRGDPMDGTIYEVRARLATAVCELRELRRKS
jgi:hypothetical protein